MTINNWDDALENPLNTFTEKTASLPTKKARNSQKKQVQERNHLYSNLKSVLVKRFNEYFEENLSDCASFMPDHIFGERHAERVVEGLDDIRSIRDLSKVLGAESLDGLFDLLFGIINEFREGSEFKAYLTNKTQYNEDVQNKMDRLNREIASRSAEQLRLEAEGAERVGQKRKRVELLKGEEIARKKKKLEEDQRCLAVFKRAAYEPSEENEQARMECLNAPQDGTRYQSSRDPVLEPSLEPSPPLISAEKSPKSKAP
ncbi:hypothetical protein PtB15_18B79 [Puccinia triticina]|nr:hypothetical protein PtB15_18B79 [Puccinia triticina]